MSFLSRYFSIIVMLAVIFTGVAIVSVPGVAFAQTNKLCEGAGGTVNADGKCVREGEKGLFDAAEGQTSIFQNIADILLFIVGAASVIMLIIGGIRYVISAGDQQAVANAKNTILYAIVGIIVAFMAYAIVKFVFDRLSADSAV